MYLSVMKKYLIVIVLLLSSLPVMSQQIEAVQEGGAVIPVESPVISLLTCSPGGELYSAWGHSALRVRYPELGVDMVFNFGIFDFTTPNFYVKFVRGKLQYMLGIEDFSRFIALYEWEKREIIEQKLSLTAEQKESIISRLKYLHEPENRYYYYSFLYKNCTTELRDLILAYTSVSEESLSVEVGETFRDLLNIYTYSWAKFGINIILGSTIDKKMSRFERMFLPDYLMKGISETMTSEGTLVAEEEVILDVPKASDLKRGIENIVRPELIASLILILVLLSLYFKKIEPLIRRGLFSVFGLAGLFILIVTIITEHTELYWNFNMLWLNPLFLIPAFIKRDRSCKLYRISLFALLLSIIALAIIWITGIQYAELGFIIIAIALVILVERELFW